MRRDKIHNMVISSVLVAFMLAGTTGLHMEKHSCSHCGVELSLSIFQEEGSLPESCCDDKESPVHRSENCDLGTSSCCSIESGTLKLDKPFMASIYVEEVVPPAIYINNFETRTGLESITMFIFKDIPGKHGGRQIIMLNSQYRT